MVQEPKRHPFKERKGIVYQSFCMLISSMEFQKVAESSGHPWTTQTKFQLKMNIYKVKFLLLDIRRIGSCLKKICGSVLEEVYSQVETITMQ